MILCLSDVISIIVQLQAGGVAFGQLENVAGNIRMETKSIEIKTA